MGISAHAPASQTLMVSSCEPDTIVLPSGEKATDITQWLCALCFSAFSSKEAAASTGAVRFELRVGGCQCLTPASHTLSVLSSEPETMVLPSGEKATDLTALLCALFFSALSSRDAAAGSRAVSFGLRIQGYQCRRTCIPHFERLVVGA